MLNRHSFRLFLLGCIAPIAGRLLAEPSWPDVSEMPAIQTVTSPGDPDFPNLPDPLRFFDFDLKTPWGPPVLDSLDWRERRRDEIKSMLRRYLYGKEPASPDHVSFTLLSEDPSFHGGAATKKVLRGQVDLPGAREFILNLYVPNGLDHPAPVLMALSKEGVDEIEPGGSRAHRWDLPEAFNRGIAVAAVQADHFASDDSSNWRDALVQPYADAGFDGDWKTIAAWAWGTSRMVDYLVSDPDIDPHRLALTGFSRRGKSALWAAALDDRIELVIPHQSGAGGAAPNRPGWGNNTGFKSSFTHWFLDEFNQNNSQWETLPFDQHFQIALIAPRRVLMSENSSSGPSYNGVLALQTAARPVWTFLGSDPQRVWIEWDPNSTHQFEPYHWAYMYDALQALPLGGMRGYRQWAVEQGLADPDISDAALKTLQVSDGQGQTFSAAELYLLGGLPDPQQDFRIQSHPGPNGTPRFSFPHRRDSLGLPGRNARWRGVRQWVETAESLSGPWTALNKDDLHPVDLLPGPTPSSERVLMEDRRSPRPHQVFYRIRMAIDP